MKNSTIHNFDLNLLYVLAPHSFLSKTQSDSSSFTTCSKIHVHQNYKKHMNELPRGEEGVDQMEETKLHRRIEDQEDLDEVTVRNTQTFDGNWLEKQACSFLFLEGSLIQNYDECEQEDYSIKSIEKEIGEKRKPVKEVAYHGEKSGCGCSIM